MVEKLNGMPEAQALISGSGNYPMVHGRVCFYEVHEGTIVMAEVYGLPETRNMENGGFYGFHIHENGNCTGDASDPFKNAGMHFNPTMTEHPKHAGDLPSLLGNSGVAWCAFYTARFYPEDVIGRSVIIHRMADDFKSQPSGDSGEKMACGVIEEWDNQA